MRNKLLNAQIKRATEWAFNEKETEELIHHEQKICGGSSVTEDELIELLDTFKVVHNPTMNQTFRKGFTKRLIIESRKRTAIILIRIK